MFDFVPYDLLFGGLLSPSRRDLVADVNPAKAPAPQVDSNAGPNDFMSPRKVRACVGNVGAVERWWWGWYRCQKSLPLLCCPHPVPH